MKIEAISAEYKDILFQFECENREYFEKLGLGRSEKYYIREQFDDIIENLIAEHNRGQNYMFLIFNDTEELVGRINITDIIRGPLQKGEVGYRIGEKHQRKGYATEALKMLIDIAKNELHLHRLEAGTSVENQTSQSVLLKNGFREVGVLHQYICINNRWIDSLMYEYIL